MFIDRTNQRDRRPPYGDQKQKHRERKQGEDSSSAGDDIVELSISSTEVENGPPEEHPPATPQPESSPAEKPKLPKLDISA